MDNLAYSQLDGWVRQAVLSLRADGMAIEDLHFGKFLLLRKLSEQLRIADANGRKAAYQQALIHARTPRDEFAFTFPKVYTAHWSCSSAYRFAKHFSGRPGELKGEGDEFKCAVEIDRLEEVKFWIRNLAPPPLIRSETSFGYPHPVGASTRTSLHSCMMGERSSSSIKAV